MCICNCLNVHWGAARRSRGVRGDGSGERACCAAANAAAASSLHEVACLLPPTISIHLGPLWRNRTCSRLFACCSWRPLAATHASCLLPRPRQRAAGTQPPYGASQTAPLCSTRVRLGRPAVAAALRLAAGAFSGRWLRGSAPPSTPLCRLGGPTWLGIHGIGRLRCTHRRRSQGWGGSGAPW